MGRSHTRRRQRAQRWNPWAGRVSLNGQDIGTFKNLQVTHDKTLTLATMQKAMKALEDTMKDSGHLVAVAGAGIMSLSEAVAKFGDKLVQCDTMDEFIARSAGVQFKSLGVQAKDFPVEQVSIYDPKPMDPLTLDQVQDRFGDARIEDKHRIYRFLTGDVGAHITVKECEKLNIDPLELVVSFAGHRCEGFAKVPPQGYIEVHAPGQPPHVECVFCGGIAGAHRPIEGQSQGQPVTMNCPTAEAELNAKLEGN